MEEKIKDWLVKTGYPLELYVYEHFAKRKYICEKSSIYSDVESNAKREIDVTAFLHGPIHDTYSYTLQLLIECKKSEKPLLILSEDRNRERYEQFFGCDVVNEQGIAKLLAFNHLDKQSKENRKINIGKFSESVPVGYSVVPAFNKSDENIYKGIIGLAKADEYYRSKYDEFFHDARNDADAHIVDQNPFQLQMPLLVVDAPLFTVSIDENGELQINSTDWASLTVHLPWNIGNSNSERKCNIQVVRKEKLDDVVCAIEKLLEYISLEEITLPAVRRITKKSIWPNKTRDFIFQLFKR